MTINKSDELATQIGKQLIDSLLKEQRANRRWRNFRFIVWLILIMTSLWLISHHPIVTKAAKKSLNGNYVALMRMHGTIDAEGEFSAENILPSLQEAFADHDAQGVILDINSGGGTPVQSAIIHDAIIYFKNKYHKKVIAVGEDFLASGAYYIAVAADTIYVNPNTITGSVGAIMKSFGFSELIKKLGIERRVYMSGTAKDRFDPFLPNNINDTQKAQAMLASVQHNFQQAVIAARGDKIHGDYQQIFNGDFWPGVTAVEIGLVDKLGNLLDAMNQEFNTITYYDYSASQSVLRDLSNFLSSSVNNLAQSL